MEGHDRDPHPEPPEPDVIVDEGDPEPGLPPEATATRTSPYAIASFAVGFIVLFQTAGLSVVQMAAFSRELQTDVVVQLVAQLTVPVVVSVIALWLSWRAQEEIDLSEGVVGGQGFMVAGRVLGALGLALVGLSLLLIFTLRNVTPGPPF